MMDTRTRRSLEHIELRLAALQRKMRAPAKTDREALDIYNRATLAHLHVAALLELDKLRAEGWQPADFAAALAEELTR